MAERKSVNKYYPPDWNPSKGTINQYVGQHPYRERARKLDQGILVVRFEMPWNIWCLGCQRHISKGVRFNAEKKCIGKFLTTKIWGFTMKCPSCSNIIVMATDPEHRDFKVVDGAKRKAEFQDEVVRSELEDQDTKRKITLDPFYKLEHEHHDLEDSRKDAPELERLLRATRVFQDDYGANARLRSKLRERKTIHRGLQREAKKMGLGIPLLPASESDRLETLNTRKIPLVTAETTHARNKDTLFNCKSIFESTTNTTTLEEKNKTKNKQVLLAKHTAYKEKKTQKHSENLFK